MAPQGHLVFYVSQGAGGYRVSVTKAAERPVKVFDSMQLGSGDKFVANLIRPGTYSVTNVFSEAKGKIVVSYPQVGRTRYTPPEALSIESRRTFSQS